MSNWFRLYENILGSHKIQKLQPQYFKLWINLLAIASENRERGYLPDDEDILFKIHGQNLKTVKDQIKKLSDIGLIEIVDGKRFMHDWSDWQYPSDKDLTAAERKRKSRRSKSQSSHGDVTRDISVSHAPREIERERDRISLSLSLLRCNSADEMIKLWLSEKITTSKKTDCELLSKKIVAVSKTTGYSERICAYVFIKKVEDQKESDITFWKTQPITADNFINKKIFDKVWALVDKKEFEEIDKVFNKHDADNTHKIQTLKKGLDKIKQEGGK